MARRTPEQQASDFIRANDASPVVSGAVTFRGEEHPDNATGVRYTLEDNSTHRLGRAAAALVQEPYPKWAV